MSYNPAVKLDVSTDLPSFSLNNSQGDKSYAIRKSVHQPLVQSHNFTVVSFNFVSNKIGIF